jgi:hypothetical protein
MGHDERDYEVAATLTTEIIFSSGIVIVKQWGIER